MPKPDNDFSETTIQQQQADALALVAPPNTWLFPLTPNAGDSGINQITVAFNINYISFPAQNPFLVEQPMTLTEEEKDIVLQAFEKVESFANIDLIDVTGVQTIYFDNETGTYLPTDESGYYDFVNENFVNYPNLVKAEDLPDGDVYAPVYPETTPAGATIEPFGVVANPEAVAAGAAPVYTPLDVDIAVVKASKLQVSGYYQGSDGIGPVGKSVTSFIGLNSQGLERLANNYDPDTGITEIAGETGMKSTVLHELGHALGLGEPAYSIEYNPDVSVMSYKNVGSVSTGANPPTGFMLYDILAIQSVWGVNEDHNAGDTVYEFGPETYVMEAVWDAGGIDTFDFSAHTQAVDVDLREGATHASTFATEATDYPNGPKSGGVWAAFGANIENAVGGAGDDIIDGNGLTNVLNGGAGHDTMFGHDGADVLLGGDGGDSLDGGVGDDLLLGGGGADVLAGGAGSDLLDGGAGSDVLDGGAGNDTLKVDALDGDTVMAGAGDDTIVVGGETGDIFVFGGTGIDIVSLAKGAGGIIGGAVGAGGAIVMDFLGVDDAGWFITEQLTLNLDDVDLVAFQDQSMTVDALSDLVGDLGTAEHDLLGTNIWDYSASELVQLL